jgi:hypothetical protein
MGGSACDYERDILMRREVRRMVKFDGDQDAGRDQ